MRVAFAAARSAPGVTTAVLACASVWPGRVLVIEASEGGGALAARFGLKLEPGVTTLAAAVRHDPDAASFRSHAQALPGTDGRVTALVGPPAPEAAQMLLRTTGDRLASLIRSVHDETVLVDLGRLCPSIDVGPLVGAADRFVLVVRPRVEELQTLAARMPTLRSLGPEPEIVLVGHDPYGPGEVAETLGCRVIGVLADDRVSADALAGIGSARGLARSPLLRSATAVVDQLRRPAPASRPDASREPTATWNASVASPGR